MPTRLRRFLAASCALVLLAGVAAPAYSSSESMRSMMAGSDPVSPTVDVLLLRPIALVTLIAGTALFIVSVPLVAITRPHEIGEPFDALVVAPAKYIWVDPIGTH
jgi:hypothetical protein